MNSTDKTTGAFTYIMDNVLGQGDVKVYKY